MTRLFFTLQLRLLSFETGVSHVSHDATWKEIQDRLTNIPRCAVLTCFPS